MPSRVARLRLAQAVESQFDTSVVAAFEAMLAGALEEYRTAKRVDFDPISVGDLEAFGLSAIDVRCRVTVPFMNGIHCQRGS